MKKYSFLILLFCVHFGFSSKAQNPPSLTIDTTSFSWTPARKHTLVKGLALGLSANPWTDSTSVNIKGLNVELGPMGLVMGLWGTVIGLAGHRDRVTGKRTSFFRYYDDSLATDDAKYPTYVSGLSISLLGLTGTHNKGLFLNGLAAEAREMKGVQFSGMLNMTDEMDGVSAALLANVAIKANGVQIGLINNCRSGNLLQIGLFNRIGKRVIPFVNFNITKRTKQPT